MKVFLDTADVDAVRRANDTGLLDGVTTHPTKIAETGKPFNGVIEEICSIVSDPVSAEAVAHSAEDIVREAEKLAAIAPHVVTKVPMNVEGLQEAAILESIGVLEKRYRIAVAPIKWLQNNS